jgi:hypothetical protein
LSRGAKWQKQAQGVCWNFWKRWTGVKEDEPTIQEIEDPLPKVREVISDVKNVETNINVGRSMWNARPLAEFNQSGWIQVDFAPLINYRMKEERWHVAKLVEDIFDQEMSGESIQKMFEEEREEGDEMDRPVW